MRRCSGSDADQGGVDDGFSLVEVIVSLALLAIISTAALYFFVSATRSVTHQQRAHGAVALANDAMENAFSWVPTASTTGTSGLVVGRTQADVTAAWAAASTVPGVSLTFPAWDTAVAPVPQAGTADDVVPLTSTETESRTQYTVTTLIGTCYRASTVTSGACTTTGGDALGTASAGYARLMRSIVVVTWPDTGDTCTGTLCQYQIASLIDPSSDVEWNNTTRLLAVDDAVAVNAGVGAFVDVDVLANDTLMQITANPVSLVSNPVKAGTTTPMGTASVDTTTGHVTYVPSTDAHGEVTFTYRVTVGARTAQALIHVYVTPQAKNFPVSTPIGTPVDIPITTVSGTAPVSIAMMSGPSAGLVSITGTSFRYSPAAVGTYTFTYTYTDSEAMTSLAGTVTVTVTTYATPKVADLSVALDSTRTPSPTTLDLRLQTVNPTDYKTRVQSLPSPGTLAAGATTLSGPTTTTSSLFYTQPAGWAGTTSFTYQMLTPDEGSASATGTVTVRVKPVAAADTNLGPVGASAKNVALNVRANDPANSGVKVQITSTPTCSYGKVLAIQPDLANGIVYFDGTNTDRRSQTCQFDYKLVTTDASSPALESATVRATVSVSGK